MWLGKFSPVEYLLRKTTNIIFDADEKKKGKRKRKP